MLINNAIVNEGLVCLEFKDSNGESGPHKDITMSPSIIGYLSRILFDKNIINGSTTYLYDRRQQRQCDNTLRYPLFFTQEIDKNVVTILTLPISRKDATITNCEVVKNTVGQWLIPYLMKEKNWSCVLCITNIRSYDTYAYETHLASHAADFEDSKRMEYLDFPIRMEQFTMLRGLLSVAQYGRYTSVPYMSVHGERQRLVQCHVQVSQVETPERREAALPPGGPLVPEVQQASTSGTQPMGGSSNKTPDHAPRGEDNRTVDLPDQIPPVNLTFDNLIFNPQGIHQEAEHDAHAPAEVQTDEPLATPRAPSRAQLDENYEVINNLLHSPHEDRQARDDDQDEQAQEQVDYQNSEGLSFTLRWTT